jgi:hypothetical protein
MNGGKYPDKSLRLISCLPYNYWVSRRATKDFDLPLYRYCWLDGGLGAVLGTPEFRCEQYNSQSSRISVNFHESS